MKVTFCSNFLTHHQLPFCLAMYERLGEEFSFVATEPMAQEQRQLGYPDLNRAYPFVIRAYEGEEQKQLASERLNAAEVVIFGSAPWHMTEDCLKEKKLVFCYSERIYKKKYEKWKWPVRLLRFYRKYGRHKSLYLLCAGAYTAADFRKTFTFINKAYKWGYFPEVRHYTDVEALIGEKSPNTITWAGRFIHWKHPQSVLEIARRLKADGYDFRIQMMGTGELYAPLEAQIRADGLEEYVHLTGALSPEEVRAHMEHAAIHLFTSDRNEGWGAVLNEAMNSGCAVVASNTIGAVPFLVENGKNGLIYESGNWDELYEQVKYLLDHQAHRAAMGGCAYHTMTGLWNGETAAQRLLQLSQALLSGEKHPQLYEDGPCSKAEIIKDR